MKIFVKAKPGAKEEKIEKISDNCYIVCVKELPVKGMANFAIIRALSEYFKTRDVRIVSGYSSRNKIIEIGGKIS